MKIRVFEAFAGYGSQAMALQRLKENYPEFDYEVIGISEIDKYALQAYNIRAIVDAVGNTEYSETFGDLCDTINELIDRVFEIEKEKLSKQNNYENN